MFSKPVDPSIALMDFLLSLLNGFSRSVGWYCSVRRLWCCSTHAQRLYLLCRKAEFEQYLCGVLPNIGGAARRYLLCADHLHRAIDGANFWFHSLDGHQNVVGKQLLVVDNFFEGLDHTHRDARLPERFFPVGERLALEGLIEDPGKCGGICAALLDIGEPLVAQ